MCSKYSSRRWIWRNSSITRCWAARPIRAARSGSASRPSIAVPTAARSRGSHQQPALAVNDLILDPADPPGHHRFLLPHRLGDGESKPLGDALLDDDVRAALQRVHHRRILVDVVHRQADQVNPPANGIGHPPERGAHLVQNLGALGVVVDGLDVGPRYHQVRGRVRHVLGEAREQTDRVLEPVPARHLGDQRSFGRQPVLLHDRRLAVDPRRDAIVAQVGRRGSEPSGPRPIVPSTEATVSASISWFFGEKASIVGGMIQIRCPSSPSQTNRWRENTSASAPFSSGRRKSQAPRTSSFGLSTPTWQRQTTDAPSSRTGLDHSGRLRIVQEHDVAAAHEVGQLPGGVGQGRLVDAPLRLPQRSSIAGIAVQVVV